MTPTELRKLAVRAFDGEEFSPDGFLTPDLTELSDGLFKAADEIESLRKRLELAEKVCELAWANCDPIPKSKLDAEIISALEEWRDGGGKV